MSSFLRRTTAALAVSLILGSLLAAGPSFAAEQGEALWLDLITEDSDAAAKFYTQLFGWEAVARPDGSSIISHQGRDIAGLFQINNEMPNASESQWLVGIVTDDLESSVASARLAGGSILRKITEVPGSGRYSVIRDPQGALLIVVSPSRESGGPGQPGFVVWVELWTDDVDAAAEFYRKVLGYQRRDIERPGGAYTVLETGGTPRAGLVPTPNEDVKPVWAPYIGVADLPATLVRTAELGGRVVLEPKADFGGGRVALIEDPDHAMIFLVQLSPDEGGSR